MAESGHDRSPISVLVSQLRTSVLVTQLRTPVLVSRLDILRQSGINFLLISILASCHHEFKAFWRFIVFNQIFMNIFVEQYNRFISVHIALCSFF